MFWGLILNANKKYTQKVKTSFHLSQAALDINNCSNEPVQVVLRSDNKNFILCTLRKNSVEQVALDLSFAEDDVISFISQGDGNVHLSGYFIPDEYPDLMNDEESESDEEEEQANHIQASNIKRKQEKKQSKEKIKTTSKKSKDEDEENDDDDEDDDGEDEDEEMPDLDFEDESDSEGEEEENDEDDEDEDDEEEEEEDDSEEEVHEPKAKQIKLDKKANITENGKVDSAQQSKKDKKKDKKEKQKQQDKKPSNEKVLTNGVKIQDLAVGNGPEAKSGSKISVYYEGRLKSNNKMFDSTKAGPGFKFVLGRGEVIKGWDIGVVGMKVGGKRRVICPPQVAYGQKGSPPVIPPNSTLVFEVELKSVN